MAKYPTIDQSKAFRGLDARRVEPVLNLHYECFVHGELVFPAETGVTDKDLVEALTLVATGLMPTVYLAEDYRGIRKCIHGATFLKALVLFMQGEITYPVDGNIESMQGKCFDELSFLEKRHIRGCSTSTVIYEGDPNEKMPEQLFSQLAALSVKMSA